MAKPSLPEPCRCASRIAVCAQCADRSEASLVDASALAVLLALMDQSLNAWPQIAFRPNPMRTGGSTP